jgi:eukaryotic-like serine/threonine-protein kinase
LFIVMEFIPGKNLSQTLKEMRDQNNWISLREAVEIVRQVALAVDYAHHQGVLHRDLKPDNIMLRPEPSEGLPYRPVITDLGLAKLSGGDVETAVGTTLGTPAYMSPEQVLGKEVDSRSDVYSLGILLFQLSTGQIPFTIKNLTDALKAHTKQPPPAPRSIRPEIPQMLEDIILKCLEKEPNQRYADASDLALALEDALPTATRIGAAPAMPVGMDAGGVTRMEEPARRGPSVLNETGARPDGTQDQIQGHSGRGANPVLSCQKVRWGDDRARR